MTDPTETETWRTGRHVGADRDRDAAAARVDHAGNAPRWTP